MVVATFPAVSKSKSFANQYDKNTPRSKKIAQSVIYGTGLPSQKMAAEGERLFSVSPDFKAAVKNHNAKNYKQAIAYYNLAIAKWPQSALLYFLRSQCFYSLNQDNLAFADVNTAIKIAPNYPHPYLYRGYLYGRNGSYSLARNDFRTTANLAIKDKNTRVYNYAQQAFAATPSSSPVTAYPTIYPIIVYPTMEFPIIAPTVPYNPSSTITP
ncbi:hypothetical protein C7B77_03825 [Chamaesiphon polymorphus CCALA 037]|uniref:Uncharacterized protein n=2 Tax=Chamaesiphon TaxID=217161 RepID=A0A2T1GLI2_9CYAN|nr:hypothetical protein C7B77_03825 [Chamaesiphon polymorphus CCALA 037]